jgi:hypothetical protein
VDDDTKRPGDGKCYGRIKEEDVLKRGPARFL